MSTFREGGRVSISGEEFVVPKATLADARQVAEVQRAAGAGEADDGFLATAQVLHILLKKARPELTVEQLLDLVEVDSFSTVLDEVQAAAGFVRLPPGEAARP